MTGIFCQKGNEKSGLTPSPKKKSSLLIDNAGVDRSEEERSSLVDLSQW